MYSKPSSGAWDFEWDYQSDKTLSDLGFTVSTNSYFSYTESGLKISPSVNNGVFFYPPIETSESSIVEALVNFGYINSWGGHNCFIISLGNGTKSSSINVQSNSIYFPWKTSASASVIGVTTNFDYLIRIEYDSTNGTKLYLDGNKISESNVFSTTNYLSNCFGAGQLSTTYVKQIRYKFG